MLTFVQTQFKGYSRNRATCQDHEAQTLNTLCNARAHMKKSNVFFFSFKNKKLAQHIVSLPLIQNK